MVHGKKKGMLKREKKIALEETGQMQLKTTAQKAKGKRGGRPRGKATAHISKGANGSKEKKKGTELCGRPLAEKVDKVLRS